MNWITLETISLIVFALLLGAFALRRRRFLPLLGRPAAAGRSFCSSELHRAAEEADRNDQRRELWRDRWYEHFCFCGQLSAFVKPQAE